MCKLIPNWTWNHMITYTNSQYKCIIPAQACLFNYKLDVLYFSQYLFPIKTNSNAKNYITLHLFILFGLLTKQGCPKSILCWIMYNRLVLRTSVTSITVLLHVGIWSRFWAIFIKLFGKVFLWPLDCFQKIFLKLSRKSLENC